MSEAIPGVTYHTLNLRLNHGVKGENFSLESRAWLKGDEEAEDWSNQAFGFTVGSSVDEAYDLYVYSATQGKKSSEVARDGVVLSGYYNKETKTFYPTKKERDAAGDDAAVYGRVLINFSTLSGDMANFDEPMPGVESLDRDAAQTWTMNYAVNVEKNRT